MDINGKTVLITGAAGGLGRAICIKLASHGAKILAADIDEKALNDLEGLGLDVETCCLDLTDEDACLKMFANRPIDILINNAGITHFSRFEDTSVETIKRVMAINFFAAVNVTKAVLPALQKSKGTIIALSSIAGFSPLLGRSGYSASKHAMQGFFTSLRSEVAEQGVRVMIICPSFIATQETVRTNEKGEAENTFDSDMGGSARPGSASQTVGQPLTPEFVAEKIYRGLQRDQDFLVLGRIGKLSYWINKFSQRLFAKLMTRKMKSEFK